MQRPGVLQTALLAVAASSVSRRAIFHQARAPRSGLSLLPLASITISVSTDASDDPDTPVSGDSQGDSNRANPTRKYPMFLGTLLIATLGAVGIGGVVECGLWFAKRGQLPLFAAILATAAPPFVIVCLTWAITRGMNGQVGRIEASSIAGVNFTLR